jgi:NitT/TauT family transport system ATP-binding protein
MSNKRRTAMEKTSTPVSTGTLLVEGVSVTFGDTAVLANFSLQVRRHEFLAVVGPSGCGKSTLLNLFSGHLQPTRGSLVRPLETRMVYQRDGLFPWLTVRRNIAIGVPRATPAAEVEAAVEGMVASMGLRGFEEHYPHQLSGGMRQRVELARAWLSDADLLLMDEPFASLDYFTRMRLKTELALMQAERPRTVILVTHDIEEAAQLADRILVLSERPARIRQEICLDLERPRDPTHPAVIDAMHQILEAMELDLQPHSKRSQHEIV